MDRSAVSAGEHNTIVVDVIDDRSGVAAVDGWFQSPRGSALIPFTCRSNGEGGAWSGDVPVPPNADCGTWTLKQLRVSDVAGNSATLGGTSPRLDRAAFGVSSDGCDATPPTLGSFFVSPAFVSNDSAAQLKVTAIVNDDASGVVAVSGWVYGPAATSGDTPKISFSCSREGSSADAPWTGRILVPQYAARGTWRVGRVAVKDKAQNVREYMPDDPEVRGGAFEVQ